jgi:hypothetical protein
MPRGKRNYTVQTPGVLESEPTESGEINTEVVTTDIGIENVRTLTDLDILAKLQALEAENAKLRAASGRVEMDGNSKFARTHSSDVDVKTITAPVLCADGWLVP